MARKTERTEGEFDYEIVNNKIYPIAEQLIRKYDELHHIAPDKILFVVNRKSGGGKKQIHAGQRHLKSRRSGRRYYTSLARVHISTLSNFMQRPLLQWTNHSLSLLSIVNFGALAQKATCLRRTLPIGISFLWD